MTVDAYYEVVWLDHRVAHLYSVTRDTITELLTIHAPDQGHGHVHHKAGTAGSGHVAVTPTFLKEVAGALGLGREILIVGPADARNALKSYIDRHTPPLAERIKGVEPMGQVSKEEIHAFALRFFRQRDLIDPMQGRQR